MVGQKAGEVSITRVGSKKLCRCGLRTIEFTVIDLCVICRKQEMEKEQERGIPYFSENNKVQCQIFGVQIEVRRCVDVQSSFVTAIARTESCKGCPAFSRMCQCGRHTVYSPRLGLCLTCIVAQCQGEILPQAVIPKVTEKEERKNVPPEKKEEKEYEKVVNPITDKVPFRIPPVPQVQREERSSEEMREAKKKRGRSRPFEDLIEEAKKSILKDRNTTVHFLAKKLRTSFPAVGKVLKQLEKEKFVGPSRNDRKPREILASVKTKRQVITQEQRFGDHPTKAFPTERTVAKLQELRLVIGKDGDLGGALDDAISKIEKFDELKEEYEALKEKLRELSM